MLDPDNITLDREHPLHRTLCLFTADKSALRDFLNDSKLRYCVKLIAVIK